MAEHIAKLKSAGIPMDKIDEYKAAFAIFDKDGSGVISASRARVAADSSASGAGAPPRFRNAPAGPLPMPIVRSCQQTRRLAQ